MISSAHEGGATCVVWLGDGALASGGFDGSVALWRVPGAGLAASSSSAAVGGGDAADGGVAPRLLRREAGAHSLGVSALSAGPGGALLSTGLCADSALWAATLPSGDGGGGGGASLARLRAWPAAAGGSFLSALSPAGSSWATAAEDAALAVLPAADAAGAPAAVLAQTGVDFIVALAWSPDGARVAVAAADGSAAVVDAATGAVVARVPRAHALPLCTVRVAACAQCVRSAAAATPATFRAAPPPRRSRGRTTAKRSTRARATAPCTPLTSARWRRAARRAARR
jgi:cytochrome c